MNLYSCKSINESWVILNIVSIQQFIQRFTNKCEEYFNSCLFAYGVKEMEWGQSLNSAVSIRFKICFFFTSSPMILCIFRRVPVWFWNLVPTSLLFSSFTPTYLSSEHKHTLWLQFRWHTANIKSKEKCREKINLWLFQFNKMFELWMLVVNVLCENLIKSKCITDKNVTCNLFTKAEYLKKMAVVTCKEAIATGGNTLRLF